jgi:hypothetical protein
LLSETPRAAERAMAATPRQPASGTEPAGTGFDEPPKPAEGEPRVETPRLRNLRRARLSSAARPTPERFVDISGRGRRPGPARFVPHAELSEAQQALSAPHPWATRWGDGLHGATRPEPGEGRCAILPHEIPIELLAMPGSELTAQLAHRFPRCGAARPEVERDAGTGALVFACPPGAEGEWRPVEFDVSTGREFDGRGAGAGGVPLWLPAGSAHLAGRWETVLARCRRSGVVAGSGSGSGSGGKGNGTISGENGTAADAGDNGGLLQPARMFTDHFVDDGLAATVARVRAARRAQLREAAAAAAAAAAKGGGGGGEGGDEPRLPPVYDDPPNINLVLLDAVSRANFFRALPRLANYLDNLHGETAGTYESYELRRFHAVDCCSFGNQTPMLSGVYVREGESQFQPRRESPKWMWNLARRHGYVTSHGIGMCVHRHWAPWERDPAVDRFFVEPFCVRGHEFEYAVGERPCVLGRDVADLVLDDAERFFAAYPDEAAGKFVFSALLHGHEPTLGVPRTADDRLVLHLQRLIERHPNTVHIVTSDHGIVWSKIGSTRTGQLERALPFAFILMPTGACGEGGTEKSEIVFLFFLLLLSSTELFLKR